LAVKISLRRNMKEALTGPVVANLVRMLRTQHKGTICIVEGDDDSKLFKSLFDYRYCRITIAFGWANATAALAILETEKISGVICIIDADLNRFDAKNSHSANLFWSDFHDLEIDLIHSDAFDKVVAEHCDDAVLGYTSDSLRNRLMNVAAPLGYMRLISHRMKLALKFSSLTLSHFIDEDTLEVNHAAMIKAVKDKSQRPDLDHDKLVTELTSAMSGLHDLRLICRGHDVTEILSIALRKMLARKRVSAKEIEATLRSAFRQAEFGASRLYPELVSWELRNVGYRLFA
jgi:hypothetical protein